MWDPVYKKEYHPYEQAYDWWQSFTQTQFLALLLKEKMIWALSQETLS